MEQKNWSVVRNAVGYHRYDTPLELELLNQIYVQLRLQTNFFSPQQRLLQKHRHGAKVSKKYATAKTPYQRVLADRRVPETVKIDLALQYEQLNPAAIRRELLALQDQLLDLVRAKHPPARLPVKAPAATRASTREATKSRDVQRAWCTMSELASEATRRPRSRLPGADGSLRLVWQGGGHSGPGTSAQVVR